MMLYRFCRSVTALFFRLFYRLKIEGVENLPPGGALLTCNHVSYFDPPLVAVGSPDPIHFLAREGLFKGLFGSLIAALNAHAISEEHNLEALRYTVGLVQSGKKVLIFPEGERSYGGIVQDLKPGLSLIVRRSKCPIVPVYIEGAHAVWPRMRTFPRLSGAMTVRFGKPLHWDAFEALPKAEVAAALSSAIKDAIVSLSKSDK